MQICPPPRPGWMVEGHYRPRTSFFDERVLGVARVSSCCSYQGDDCVWAQRSTVAVPMRSNWSGGPVRSPLVGCIRNRINLKNKERVIVIVLE